MKLNTILYHNALSLYMTDATRGFFFISISILIGVVADHFDPLS